jgi:23S rRNA pseudouridine2604 synthase
MGNGIPVLDTVTKKCFVKQTHKNQFRIILTQGLNRQIRRMCEFLNYRVKDLIRVRIMNIKLDVKVGKWRYFNPDELNTLNQLLNQSSKTHR